MPSRGMQVHGLGDRADGPDRGGGLGGGSYLVIGGVWRRLGGEPEYARQMMRWIASGDLSHEVRVDSTDRSSLLSAVAEMQRPGLPGEPSAQQRRYHQPRVQKRSRPATMTCRCGPSSKQPNWSASNRMRQLTDMVQRNADSARCRPAGGVCGEVARRGGEVVGAVVETMGSIDASSKRIREITSVIDGILSDQHPGPERSGRGGPCRRARPGLRSGGCRSRNLAQRSATTAKEISSLIGASVEQVENGSTLVQRAGDTMTEIVASVRRVNDIMGEIDRVDRAGRRHRRCGSGDLDHGHDHAAKTRRWSKAAAAASSLEEQSRTLLSTVSTFKLPWCPVRPSQAGPLLVF